jgi:glycosyltransferase involved in cell wall biosynthesis
VSSDWGAGGPLVSVVVPTKDRAALLGATLRSICGQETACLEVIVVDDGSVDPDAVRSVVAPLHDRRVRVLRQPVSGGVSAARNRGLEEATGDWVAFCDDDDLWASTKIMRQLRALQRTGRSWAYVGAVDIDRSGRVVKGSPPPLPDSVVADLPKVNVIPGGCSGVLAQRTLLTKVGGFDPGLSACADWDLWLKLLAIGPPGCAPEPLVGYRLHPSNMSLNEGRMVADFAVLKARYGTVNQATFSRYLFWWALRSQRRGAALSHWISAARAPDKEFGPGLLATDLRHLLRRSAEVLLARTRYTRFVARRMSARPPDQPTDPYVVSASTWFARYEAD